MMATKSDPVLAALRKASKGLLFPSESDADIEPFAWKGGDTLTVPRVLELSGTPAGTAVEQTTLAELWRTIPTEERGRFQPLQKLLQTQLSGVVVYKIGDEAERTVYVIGKTNDGRWAGVKTTVVET